MPLMNDGVGLPAREIATAVEHLLEVEVLAIENEEVFTAMVALQRGARIFVRIQAIRAIQCFSDYYYQVSLLSTVGTVFTRWHPSINSTL